MTSNIDADVLRQAILGLPEFAAWPEVVTLFTAKADTVRLDWQLPALACQAAGGSAEIALNAVAAIACLQISIILADDILDQDPRGEYRRLGEGRTANLALALQAGALTLLCQAPVAPERRALAVESLAHAALGTAFGQDLDVQNLHGEENYWRVVKAKSTPFYGAAFQTGALLAGAGPEVAQGLYEVGVLLGEMIQVFDDLADAFAAPANPDWLEGRNNLALLYTATARHPRQEEFQRLLGHVEDPQDLRTAQEILISAGAVSYCVYLLLGRARAAREMISRLALADPAPMLEVVRLQMAPLMDWLRKLGLPVPDELANEIP